MEIFFGFIFGIIASIAAWYILFHLIVPKVKFLALYREEDETSNSGFRYLIEFENIGLRSIIDIELIARLRIKGLRKKKKTWKSIYIPFDDDRLPRIKCGRKILVQILPDQLNQTAQNSLDGTFVEKIADGSLTLEELMQAGESELQIFGFGYDSLSGSRKLFESK